MNPRKAVFSLALVLVVFVPLALAQGTYTQIDFPGSPFTVAMGINGDGDVVGAYYTADSELHGFLLSGGSFASIEVPGAGNTMATGVDHTGHISGYFSTSDGRYHGYLFYGQGFTTLDFPGALQTYAMGINNAAQIVGYYVDANEQMHGFKYSSGTFVTIDFPGAVSTFLTGINNKDNVVGYYEDAGQNLQSFVLSPQGTFRLIGHGVGASGVNDHNTVVGFKGNFGFRFDTRKGLYVRMRTPDSLETICLGINASSHVVGKFVDAAGGAHGFLWTPPADAAKK